MPAALRIVTVVAALVLSAPLCAALPGVTEFKTGADKLTDTELGALLHKSVSAADVIAIGETVHGSAGLLHVQTRLIRYLVTQHGLRLIVWENALLRSHEFAQWVASCATTRSPPPLDVFYFPTAADAPLWAWVCDFNRAHPGNPVVFRGMDVWDRPWALYARIRGLHAQLEHAGIDAARLTALLAPCPAREAESWPQVDAVLAQVAHDGKFLPQRDYDNCREALARIIESATRAAANLKKESRGLAADDAYELALAASTLLGWLEFYHDNGSDDIRSWNARSRAQGRNLALLMAKHGAARAIVAAHSSHVSHNRSPADWWGFGDIKSGVHFFARATGKKVFNIALTAYEASGAQGQWSLPTARNSMDKTLYDAGHTFAYFTADAAFIAAHPRWWMQNQNTPGRYDSGVAFVPKDHFDAYFFLRQSHLDKALPARSVWQP